MSRISLKILQQAARRSLPEDRPIKNLPEMGSFPGLKRRQVLQGGLALTSAITSAIFSPPSFSGTKKSQTPVLIVGCGLGGVTAAYRLHQAGVPVELIEARNRIGGRTFSIPKALGTSSVVEMGGEFIDSSHKFITNLAKELGLTIIDREESLKGNIIETFFFQGRYISNEELIREIAPLVPKMTADVEKMKGFTDYTTPNLAAQAFDRLSVSEYLDTAEISPLIRSVIEVCLVNVFGNEATELSALYLLFTLGLGAVVDGEYQTVGESDERFYLQGGNSQLTRLLSQKMPNRVSTSTVLEAIMATPAGRYKVAMRSGGTTKERIYDRVILALPFSVLREIPLRVDLPEYKRRVIAELNYANCAKIICRFREKVWITRYQRSAYAWTDEPFQSTWDPSNSLLNPQDALITNYLSGKAAITSESQPLIASLPSFVNQFERMFPGVKEAFLPQYGIKTDWLGSPYSRGTYTSYSRGQWTAFSGSESKRVGNLFFAGEHTATNHQNYMEGACESGERVAIEVLESLGLKDRAAQQRAYWRQNS